MRSCMFIVGAFGLAIATACGDPGYEMFVETVPARRSWCTSSARIRPATAVSSCSLERRRLVIWFRPRDENDKQETKVRAVNSAGSLVFCRAYSYERAKDNFHW